MANREQRPNKEKKKPKKEKAKPLAAPQASPFSDQRGQKPQPGKK